MENIVIYVIIAWLAVCGILYAFLLAASNLDE